MDLLHPASAKMIKSLFESDCHILASRNYHIYWPKIGRIEDLNCFILLPIHKIVLKLYRLRSTQCGNQAKSVLFYRLSWGDVWVLQYDRPARASRQEATSIDRFGSDYSKTERKKTRWFFRWGGATVGIKSRGG